MSMPTSCNAVASDSDIPNNMPPTNAQIGRPRASIAMTMAMKPAPPVTNGTNAPPATTAR